MEQQTTGIDPALDARLRAFLAGSRFAERGAVVTDLDGTAVHEIDGRVTIPTAVELGLERLYQLGHPVIINTLRFPLSVIRTFGREWYALSEAPIHVVCLDGALRGRIERGHAGDLVFQEIDADVLTPGEVESVLARAGRAVDHGLRELLLFAYPRDWRRGEIVWTPSPARLEAVRAKYRSATTTTAEPMEALRRRLLADELCLVFVLADAPHDRLMAYQHAKRTAFHTHAGVDKLAGAQRMAAALGVSLPDSIGAGDTAMDTFLAGVGLAVQVADADLPFRGLVDTLRLPDSTALGDLLFRLGDLLLGDGR